MEQVYYQSHRGTSSREMSQKPTRDAFFTFNHKAYGMRPMSVATEFVDTDWEEEDDYSDTEENNNSPRVSLQSGQPSFTTVSSYDEVPTPRTSRDGFTFGILGKPVEGPHGPHLFRSSVEYPPIPTTTEDDIILSLSPITPKVPRGVPVPFHRSLPPPRRNSPFKYTSAELQQSVLPQWTPEMVAQSMLNAGIEQTVADRFIENDITGAILITLKFEDLKELDIQSFGIRTTVWHQIQALRDHTPASPRPPTPIEDEPSREARKETQKPDDVKPKRRPSGSTAQRNKSSASDTIMPGDSVSIIGIEQVVPKPHVCSKGENCSKWRKQQRLIERFMKLNPTIDINANAGGKVMIVGDAGNPETARALDPNENWRPFSDAEPSVVASSDVLGTDGMPPLQYLQEASLRNLDRMDTQDNVRQFLRFQQGNQNDVPPTPPYELAPQAPHQGLRRLPRLSIPSAPQPPRPQPPRAATVSPRMQLYAEQRGEQCQEQFSHEHAIHDSPHEFVPYQMDKADPRSPDLETRHNPYRFGTPFSEMDVPVTAVPQGPVARDTSQSVPPDMSYRHGNANPPRAQSRTSRRPSFPVLPALDENRPVRTTSSQSTSPRAASPPKVAARRQPQPQPLHAPPRANYPWSPVDRPSFEQVLPPSSTFDANDGSSTDSASSNGISHAGPMKKRKTKFLRHEWQDGYFTVKGTRLNMHKDVEQLDRTLEYVDIDDYAIACSSLASTSKLSAAFKAVSISHNRNKSNPVGAFQFQLIPMDKEKTSAKLRKRESSVSSSKGTPAEGVNGTGKTHHFAVTSRDDRIDWMRELMLAKTRKQKQEGFEVKVNGADMI